MRGLLLTGLLMTCVAACGDDDSPTPRQDAGEPHDDAGADGSADGDSDGGDDGGGDGGADGDGHEDAGVDAGDGNPGEDAPLLERPARDPLACEVSQELLNYKPLSWGFGGSSIASDSDEVVWAVRVEGDGTNHHEPTGQALVLSTVAADGELGANTTIPVGDPQLVSRPLLAALPGGGVVVVWLEDDELRFATFDASGDPQVAPKTLVGDLEPSTFAALAVSAQGRIGVAWVEASYVEEGPYPLSFLSVDAQGVAAGAPTPIGSGHGVTPALVAAPQGGFALLWSGPSSGGTSFRLSFASVTETGAIATAAREAYVAEGDGDGASFSSARLAFTALDNGYLAAWSEGENGFDNFEGAYQEVRLRKLGLDGAPAEHVHTLRERTIDIDEVEPSFVHVGDTLGLLWSRGSHIYICAGCVPDNSMQFVLLDPDDLTPRSNVVEVAPNPTWGGGLLRSSPAASGQSILVTTAITFHTWQEPGFAAFRCE